MNETTSINDKNNIEIDESLSLGVRLRTTREALNISIDEVAKQLHLMPSVIKQIENNQFQLGKGNAVFIRGYIRSYSKFLNLPQDEIIEIFNNLYTDESQENSMHPFIYRKTKKSSSEYWVFAISSLMLLVFLFMAFIWWRSAYSISDLIHEWSYSLQNKTTLKKHTPLVQSASQEELNRSTNENERNEIALKLSKKELMTTIDSQTKNNNLNHSSTEALPVDIMQHQENESITPNDQVIDSPVSTNPQIHPIPKDHPTVIHKKNSTISPPFQRGV